MVNSRLITCFVLALILLVTAPLSGAGESRFEQLCGEILESLQSFQPVHATRMGIHSYDNRLTDYSPKNVSHMIKQLKNYEQKLYKYRDVNLSTYDRVNYRLIKSNVDVALLDLDKIRWYRKSPQLYVTEAVDGVYSLLQAHHAPMSERLEPLLARMEAVPSLFAVARTNLEEPPPVFIEAALAALESGSRFFQDVAAEMMNRFPERANRILQAATGAREAMNEFSFFLDSLPPGSETSFAIGKEHFDYLLAHQYFLPVDSDSLLLIGESLLVRAQEAYHRMERDVEANHQSGRDSIYVPAVFTREDILGYYNWETEQVRLFLEQNDIISIPEDIAPVTVIETPLFLRTMIGGIAYEPAAPFDSAQRGYFYVRPIPDDLERSELEARYRFVHRRGFRGSVVHEAFPGHHLQLQIAARHHDPVRRWQMNLMMIEGWALYCEEMMYHAGLFGEADPAQWLAILDGIRFRAARVVADVKLHTGQFTYDECVQWLIQTLDIETDAGKEYIRTEVRRYTQTPTHQMTYLIGKRELVALRDAAERQAGDGFVLREFHDELLAHGSIPPMLLWDILNLTRTTPRAMLADPDKPVTSRKGR